MAHDENKLPAGKTSGGETPDLGKPFPRANSPIGRDRLGQILSLQERLNSRVSVSFEDALKLPTQERVEWVDKMLKAISNEMEEIRNELPWKWWKPAERQTEDWGAARDEWIDLFHFVLALGLVLGYPPDGDAVYKKYLGKNEVNHDRQTDWYKDVRNGKTETDQTAQEEDKEVH